MFSPEGYEALTKSAGVVRRTDRGVLAVTGPDRLTWLQGLLTNDVVALPVPGICDAAYLTPQGRMITDMRVVNLADQTLLDVPAPLAASLGARLDSLLFSEDAHVADSSHALAIIDVHGPSAARVVDGLDLLQDDAFGVPGYSGFVPMSEVNAVIAQLVGRGARATTLETLDVVRIEAGRPAFLVDMDEHTIPLEAGLEARAISFTKGCYVGQEVIVRVTQRGGGRVARKLVGLRLAEGPLPSRGDVIRSGTREIGRLTSVTWSPALASGIALGYVHRDFVQPGTVVEIMSSHGVMVAQVTVVPFVSRDR
jgi:folate-binding protein YgfZ